MIRVPIYPIDAPKKNWASLTRTSATPFSEAEHWVEFFAQSARFLLDRVLSSMRLRCDDQIAILTTSDEAYVSTCLSITAFNHASISRVITETTRVVIIVHEFGYLYPNIIKLCASLRARGIAIIEDCAHVLGAKISSGLSVGSIGDYSLFSLPKIFPLNKGGLLRVSPTAPTGIQLSPEEARLSASIHQEFINVIPLWQDLNRLRLRRYEIFFDQIGSKIVQEKESNDIPWMTYVFDSGLSPQDLPNVEFGATLRKNCLLIPTNPFVEECIFEHIADAIIQNRESRGA